MKARVEKDDAFGWTNYVTVDYFDDKLMSVIKPSCVQILTRVPMWGYTHAVLISPCWVIIANWPPTWSQREIETGIISSSCTLYIWRRCLVSLARQARCSFCTVNPQQLVHLDSYFLTWLTPPVTPTSDLRWYGPWHTFSRNSIWSMRHRAFRTRSQ